MSLAGLLHLPAELRSLVFEHVLRESRTLVTFRLDDWQRDSYVQASQPPLTRVSRQIRAESLELWYELSDFVLHTSKIEQSTRWLRCNSSHLNSLRHLSLWIRYEPSINSRATSQGIIRFKLTRSNKNEHWTIDPGWTWVTVVRKPPGLNDDAKLISRILADHGLMSNISSDGASIGNYHALVADLRHQYAQHKRSHP